jgi:hypothetical protein
MRRFVAVTALLCVAFASLFATSALAGKSSKGRQVQTADYTGAGGALGESGTFYGQGTMFGGVSFMPRAGQRHVAISIVDGSGLPVAARLTQAGPDGFPQTSVDMCGRTDGPVKIAPNVAVVIGLMEGPCDDGTPAAATQGTVTATFSGRR